MVKEITLVLSNREKQKIRDYKNEENKTKNEEELGKKKK